MTFVTYMTSYTRLIHPTYILDLYTRPIYFGLVDVPLVQVLVLTHVGKLGQGQRHVLLHEHVEYFLLYDQVKVS